MRPSRSGISQVMVGRDDELRRLARLVDSGDPSVALVAGEPGIGKSRLIQELIAELPQPVPVLSGQADPGALSRPFELLFDVVDGSATLSRTLDPALLHAVADTGHALVERLHAGLDIIAQLTTPGPAVVVFEDLHWADSESVALFERIADLPGPRLLIGTYRPDEVTRRHPMAEMLTRLERRHNVTHLRLDRLSLAETSTFLKVVVGRAPSYRAAVSLHNRTGGNPFFLEELLKARRDDDLERLCDHPLPWNVAEALRRQIDDLGPEQQRIVEAAAVLGRRVPFDLLAAVTRASEDALIEVLRDLVQRGLMVETGDDEFSFRHALTREALVDELLGRQRRRLHELALETLLATGSKDDALVAHHARGAGRYEEMVAAARAGLWRYLAIGSPYQALQLAETGLEEVPDDVELLAGAAESAWLVGLLDDAQAHAGRWLAAVRSADGRAGALRLLMRISWDIGALDELKELTMQLQDEIADMVDCPAKAHAFAAVGQSYMLRECTDDALAWSDRAIDAGELLGLPEVRLAGMVEKGSALVDAGDGRVGEGVRLLKEAADESERLGEWVLAARALKNLFGADLMLGPAELAAVLERMRADAERAGFDSLAVASYHQGRARIALQHADLDTAIAELQESRSRDRRLPRTTRRTDYNGVMLAGLYLEVGNLDKVDMIISTLLAAPQASKVSLTALRGLVFHLACRRGDRAAAERHLGVVLETVDQVGAASGDYVHDLVAAGLTAGLDTALLHKLADRMSPLRPNNPFQTLVTAQLAEADGDMPAALDAYLAAAGAGSALLAAPRATAHAGAARCLLAAGRTAEARDHTAQAEELLTHWSGWRVAEVRFLRTALGMPELTGDGDTEGVTTLTPREREVALLLAEGLTNAELARRLFISPRTAAVHVSSILGKLQVTSRTQVASRLTA